MLTGSANLLLMRQVADTLAGRASYLTLPPMTRRERRGLGAPRRGSELLATRDEPAGAHLENLVLNDLLAWRAAHGDDAEVVLAHGEEVDFVIEAGGRVVPIEVNAADRVGPGDARHLATFREDSRRRSRAGLLLHTGERTEWLAPGLLAVPWWRVL